MNGSEGEEPVIEINARKYTDEEKQLILQVVARDEEVHIQEKSRLDQLKIELKHMKEKGVPEGQEEEYGRVCKRCRAPLGLVFNSGEFCPTCGFKVCKDCQLPVEIQTENPLYTWTCAACSMYRAIRAESGAWFYSGPEQVAVKKKKIYGSMLMKRVFSIARKRDSIIYKDPVWNEIVEGEILPDIEEDQDDLLVIVSKDTGKQHSMFNDPFTLQDEDSKHLNCIAGTSKSLAEAPTTAKKYVKPSKDKDGSFAPKKASIYYNPDLESSSSEDEGIFSREGTIYEHPDESIPDTDVTALKKLEDELPESEKNNQFASSGSVDVVLHENKTDSDMLIVDINRRVDGNVTKDEGEEDIDDIVINFMKSKDGDEVNEKSTLVDRKVEVGSSKPLILAEILIGLRYDYNDNILEIQVHKAKNLRPPDDSKVSVDPYVKVYLNSVTRSLGKKKTKVKKNKLNPDFDELLTFKVDYEELLSSVLDIGICHKEFAKNNSNLGEVSISLDDHLHAGFSLETPDPKWYRLHTKRLRSSQVTFSGELIINLQYQNKDISSSSKGQLHINIIQAKGIKAVEEKFFVEISLVISENSAMNRKSKLVSHDHLYWDEDFILDDVSLTELESSYLQLSLRGLGENLLLIGGARLGLGQSRESNHDSFGEEVKAWQRMLSRVNECLDFSIPLRSSLDILKKEPRAIVSKDLNVDINNVDLINIDEDFDIIKKSKKDSFVAPSVAKRLLNSDALSMASSSGSMLSIYSNAGGDNGNLVITGDILFSLKHDLNSNVFSINLIKAKGIAAANEKKQTSDPYVKIYLYPDELKNTKKKTPHRKKTLNPEWNETLKYTINREELLKKTLQVSIWNHDRFGRNDFLGEVQVNIKNYTTTNDLEIDSPEWYTLQESAPISIGDTDESKGQIKVGIRFDQGVLNVHIKHADGLSFLDSDYLPNVFVKCYLLPDKSRKSKRKTMVQKKTKSPIWNEKFDYKGIEVDDLYSRVLEVTLWDHNSSGHQFLGGLRLGLPQGDENWHDCFGKEVDIWEAMMKHLGILAEYTIPLRATMTSRKEQMTQALPMIVPTINEEKPSYLTSNFCETNIANDRLPESDKKDEISKSFQPSTQLEVTEKTLDDKPSVGVPVKINTIDTSVVNEGPNVQDNEFMYESKKKIKKDSLAAQRFDTLSIASSGSMLSLYSNSGDSGNLVVTGDILFSMHHDPASNIFSVHIVKAKEIAAANEKKQTSDPYVKLYLYPEDKKSSKQKTTHKRKTLNPEWNEKINYTISQDDLINKTLQVSIWNHDRLGKNVFLGEVQVNMKDYSSNNDLETDLPVWYTLQEIAPLSSSGSNECKGELTVGLMFDQGILNIHIKEALGLVCENPGSLLNSFVKCHLLPDKSRKTKRKTTVKKKTNDPIWDEKFDYKDLYISDLRSKVLEITVWDHNSSGHQFLGGLRLGLPKGDEYWHDCFEKEVEIWEGMMKKMGTLSELSIPLRETMTSRKGQTTHELPMITSEFQSNTSETLISLSQPVKVDETVEKIVDDAEDVVVDKIGMIVGVESVEESVPSIQTDISVKHSDNFPAVDIEIKETELPKENIVSNEENISDIIDVSEISPQEKQADHVEVHNIEVTLGGQELSFQNKSPSSNVNIRASSSVQPKDEYIDDINEIKKKLKKDSFMTQSATKRLMNADTLSIASSGSMLSLYSNSGDSGNLVVTGDILFSMHHDPASNVFSVVVVKAKEIAAANEKKQTSDPYVKLYLYPDDKKSSKQKTTHKRKTLNPEWNEKIKYTISHDELINKTLQVSIWNHDRLGKNVFLGEVQVNMKDYSSNNDLETDLPVWYTLQEIAPLSSSGSNESKGELTVGLMFDQGILNIHIKEALGLICGNPGNLLNSFVKCHLLPDKSRKTKRKTTVKKKTNDPIWNEKFEYKDLYISDLRSKVLEITIWDHNSSGHQFLGGLRLGLPKGDEYWHDCFEKEVEIWEGMMKKMGTLSELSIPLRETMTSRKGQTTHELPMITSEFQSKEPGIRTSLSIKDEESILKSEHNDLQSEEPVEVDENIEEMVKNNEDLVVNKIEMMVGDEYVSTAEEKISNPFIQTDISVKHSDNLRAVDIEIKETELPNENMVSNEEDISHNIDAPGLSSQEKQADHVEIYDAEVTLGGEELSFQNKSPSPNVDIRASSSVPSKDEYIDDMYESKKKLKKDSFLTQSATKRLMNADTLSIASSGSMLSLYSNSGDSGNLIVTGDILFSMHHDPTSNIFSVVIVKAKEIAAANEKKQTSDPYVKLYLYPDDKKSSKEKTTHKRKTLNPEWNEKIKYTISRDKLINKTLQVSIWNHDRLGKNVFLGEVQVNMKDYSSNNDLETDLPVWYTLQEMASVSVSEEIENKGELKIGLTFGQGVLTVHIKQTDGLSYNSDTLPNSFVKCHLLPDKSRKTKRKTTVKKKTLSPVWNEEFEYKDLYIRDLRSRVLEVTLWDYNSKGHGFIGGLRLGLPQGDEYWHDCFGKEVEIWEGMMKKFGVQVEYSIPLRATMTSRKGQGIQDSPSLNDISLGTVSITEKLAKEDQERLEKERIAKDEQERFEKERIAKEEQEHLEKERIAKEDQERVEAERIMRDEQERLEKEGIAREEQERLEKERIARERQECLEKERIAKEEQERIMREEQECLEKERIAKEEQERFMREEQERLEREQIMREEERLEKERIAREEEEFRIERERQYLEKENAERERNERERRAMMNVNVVTNDEREEDIDDLVINFMKSKDIENGKVESNNVIDDHTEDKDEGNTKEFESEIRIGLKYDYKDSIFEVQIHKATDLLPPEKDKSSADPYAKVYLNSMTRSLGKKKTKTIKNTLNPEFDEMLTFKVGYEELTSSVLDISVWHHGFAKNNVVLGEVEIDIEDYLSSGFTFDVPIPQWYKLHPKRLHSSEVTYSGELVLNLQYKNIDIAPDSKGQLHINIIQAKALKSKEEKYFIEMSLVIGEHDIRRMKSKLVSGSQDPFWDEDFIVDNVTYKQLESSYLQIGLQALRGNLFLVGGARLGLGQSKDSNHDSFGEEVKVWQSMLSHSNEPQDFCIPLRDSLDILKKDLTFKQPIKDDIDEDFDKKSIKKSKKESLSAPSAAKRLLNTDALSLSSFSSGSMLSIYSSSGGDAGNLVITGDILFSMCHDSKANTFNVTIVKAKGIAAANEKKQTSDPYVKLYLYPDDKKTTKRKTIHKRKTLNPEWNEKIKYTINRDDLLNKTLQVSLWNHDRLGRNDFLGEVQVNMKNYISNNDLAIDMPVWYTLQEMAPISVSETSENKGELIIGLRFDQAILNVHIKQAVGLSGVNAEISPNSFVKCQLLPDKSKKGKRKTTVKKKTSNPIWDEKFEYKNLYISDLRSHVLEVTVWDHNSSGHQFLGGLRLGLPQGDEYWHDCFGKEIDIWEGMMKHLGILAEYSIPLRATMTSRKGQITQDLPMVTDTQGEFLSKPNFNTSAKFDVILEDESVINERSPDLDIEEGSSKKKKEKKEKKKKK